MSQVRIPSPFTFTGPVSVSVRRALWLWLSPDHPSRLYHEGTLGFVSRVSVHSSRSGALGDIASHLALPRHAASRPHLALPRHAASRPRRDAHPAHGASLRRPRHLGQRHSVLPSQRKRERAGTFSGPLVRRSKLPISPCGFSGLFESTRLSLTFPCHPMADFCELFKLEWGRVIIHILASPLPSTGASVMDCTCGMTFASLTTSGTLGLGWGRPHLSTLLSLLQGRDTPRVEVLRVRLVAPLGVLHAYSLPSWASPHHRSPTSLGQGAQGPLSSSLTPWEIVTWHFK